jgi:hypothetical protein
MHHCAESIFKIDYLREYESIFETVLAHESVDPGVLYDEKTSGRKSLETVSLRQEQYHPRFYPRFLIGIL